jgi:hypothetical protein
MPHSHKVTDERAETDEWSVRDWRTFQLPGAQYSFSTHVFMVSGITGLTIWSIALEVSLASVSTSTTWQTTVIQQFIRMVGGGNVEKFWNQRRWTECLHCSVSSQLPSFGVRVTSHSCIPQHSPFANPGTQTYQSARSGPSGRELLHAHETGWWMVCGRVPGVFSTDGPTCEPVFYRLCVQRHPAQRRSCGANIQPRTTALSRSQPHESQPERPRGANYCQYCGCGGSLL